MNSLKNLMIMVVLAAVGYGVYVSLARNNVDPPLPPEVAEQWQQPSAPTVEMPDAARTGPAAQPGGSLAIGTGIGPESAARTPGQTPLDNPPVAAPNLTTVEPYPPSDATAALGPPVSAGSMAAPPGSGGVRNLSPPPVDSRASEADDLLRDKFAAFMEEVQRSLKLGKLAEAHQALSMLYTRPDLPEEQARQIVGLLDQLAGTVIYSREHYLEPAYRARGGETIEQIARQHQVPWQLLARINGLMPPDAPNDDRTKDQPLPDGMELKVVRGPFDAIVNLEKRELTLMLQDRYAGRFAIGVGRDHTNIEGIYTVEDKILNPVYNGPGGISIPPDDPRNPLGKAWIGLSAQVGIHGAADPRDLGRDDNQGSICVAPRDIQDLFGILSIGSRVKVTR
ncbi:MAG: L,D-transpeptidase family protein [Pirellulaceae bacterium]|nr:L,D-transpeptidase family protein [Pirellulaceae bacterium]